MAFAKLVLVEMLSTQLQVISSLHMTASPPRVHKHVVVNLPTFLAWNTSSGVWVFAAMSFC